MIKFIASAFIVLHGLVHLLYFGQSVRLFELQPGVIWPDGSWAFTKLLGEFNTRTLAGILLVLAAAGLMTGGAGIFFSQSWWRVVVAASAVFSAILFLLLWDGRLQNLPNHGAVGLLIDVAILLAVLVFRWPALD